MRPEEYLDRLIDGYEREDFSHPAKSDEVTACMNAKESLAQLNEIPVPPSFANRLEFTIRTRVRSMNEQEHWNVSSARIFGVNRKKRSYIQPIQSRNSGNSQPGYKRHTWIALFRIAAVFIIAGIGILTASARSLPGDALYSLNQAERQFVLTFADAPQNRADLQIAHLRSALVDLKTVVNDGRGDEAIRLALDTVSAKTIDSQEAFSTLPANASHSEAQQEMTQALSEEDRLLRQLLNSVDWPIRLAFTQQLAALGEPVPILTHAVVHVQSDGTLMFTLSGSYFSSQAQFMINGQQTGIVRQIIPSKLVAVARNVGQARSTFRVGIRNSDGTAAELVVNAVEDNNTDRQDDNRSKQGTPVPYPCRRPDD